MRIMRTFIACGLLGLCLLAGSAWAAGGVSLTFDDNLVGAPPQDVFSSGIGEHAWVKVVHDGIRAPEDLCAEFKAEGDQPQPRECG